MSSTLRVIFMGTPEFAVPSLERIIDEGYDVPLVVSVPDRPQGRGRKLQPSAVARRGGELGLRVETPENLKDESFRNLVAELRPDVICVVAFRILPESIFSIPSRGSFNLHGSLLPAFRGAAPINRAIMAISIVSQPAHMMLMRRPLQAFTGMDLGDPVIREQFVQNASAFVRGGLAVRREDKP